MIPSLFQACACVLGNNALLRMLYEVDGDTAVEGRLLDVPSLWRYRARVTLEHLKREIEEERGNKQKNSPYPVLDLFLREVVNYHVVSAVFVQDGPRKLNFFKVCAVDLKCGCCFCMSLHLNIICTVSVINLTDDN